VNALAAQEAKARQNLADKQADLSALESRMGTEQTKVDQATQNIERVKAKIVRTEAMSTQLADTEEQLEASGDEPEELSQIRQKQSEAEETLKLLQEELSTAETHKAKLAAGLAELEQKQTMLKSELNEFAAKVQGVMERKGAALQGLQALLEQKIERSTQAVSAHTKRLAEVAAKLKALKAELEQCHKDASASCDKLDTKVGEVTEQLKTIQQELDASKKMLHAAESDRDKWKRLASSAQDGFLAAEGDAAAAKADLMVNMAAETKRQAEAAAAALAEAEAKEQAAKKQAADLAVAVQELSAKKAEAEAKLAKLQELVKQAVEAVEQAEQEMARLAKAKIAAETAAAEKQNIVTQLREELASCNKPSLHPVNCDDIKKKLETAEAELAQAKAQVKETVEAYEKATVVYKQAKARSDDLNKQLAEALALVEQLTAELSRKQKEQAAAEQQVAAAAAVKDKAAAVQAAAAEKAEKASATAKAALAAAAAQGACDQVKKEEERKPINTVALERAKAECAKATQVAARTQTMEVSEESIAAAEEAKEAAKQELSEAKEKVEAVKAAAAAAERQAEEAQAELDACLASAQEPGACSELEAAVEVAKLQVQTMQAEVQKAEVAAEQALAKAEKAEKAVKQVKQAQAKKAGKAEAVKKGAKAAAAFKAKEAKKAAAQAGLAVDNAKRAKREARKLEAQKKEKVKVLKHKLDACRAKESSSAECAALEEEFKQAEQELKKAELASELADLKVEQAENDLSEAQAAVEAAEDEFSAAVEALDAESTQTVEQAVLEAKQMGTFDTHGVFDDLQRNVTSKQFNDWMDQDTHSFDTQFDESSKAIRELDEQLVKLESQADDDIAAASHTFALKINEQRAEVAKAGRKIDVLEHEVKKQKIGIRDLQNQVAASEEHSKIHQKQEQSLNLLVEAGAARHTAAQAKKLSQQLQSTKQEVELTAQFGKEDLKEALEQQAAAMEIKRSDLEERAGKAEAFAAQKEAAAASIRKGVSELMAAWQGALETVFPAIKEILELKEQMVNTTASVPDNTEAIKAKLAGIRQTVTEYMHHIVETQGAPNGTNPEDLELPDTPAGTVDEMVTVLDKKAMLVDAFRIHRELKDLIKRVDHTELLSKLHTKYSKMEQVIKKARALRLSLAKPLELLEKAKISMKATGITRSVTPKILELRAKIDEAETIEGNARARAEGVKQQMQNLDPPQGSAASQLESCMTELTQLKKQTDTCEQPDSALCQSITQEYEHQNRKCWMLKRESTLEDEIARLQRDQRSAVSEAAASRLEVTTLEKQVDDLKEKMGTLNKQAHDAEQLRVLEIRLGNANEAMWKDMEAAANSTTRAQHAQAELSTMQAVIQVKSAASVDLQQKLFDLEATRQKADTAEIDTLLAGVGQLNSLADDAYRSMVEQREQREQQAPSEPEAQKMHEEAAGYYEKADAAGSAQLRDRFNELARLKKQQLAAHEHQKTHAAELEKLVAEKEKSEKELQADSSTSQDAVRAVATLQQQKQTQVAQIRKKLAVRIREPLIEKFKQVQRKDDATEAEKLLSALRSKREVQVEKLDLVTRPLWAQIGLIHERHMHSAIDPHIDAANAVLDQIRRKKQQLLKSTHVVVETEMLARHQAAAVSLKEAAAESSGVFETLQRKVKELQDTLNAEKEASDMPAEALQLTLADLENELAHDRIKMGRTEEQAWLSNAKSSWLQQTQVDDFEKALEEKQKALDQAVSLNADELNSAARKMTTNLAEMWHQTTMEDTVARLKKAQKNLQLAQQRLAPWTLVHPEASVPTVATFNATFNATFKPRKSPVEWEAHLHKKDMEATEHTKQEVEEHLTVATQVAKQRGVEPPTVDDAAADAAERATAEAARVAAVHGNGLDPDKMPLLSRVGVPPPAEVEPPEPAMPPPPADPIEIQAEKVNKQAKHVELLNAKLANLTKMASPEDDVENMRHEAELDSVGKQVTVETNHLQKAKQVLADLEGSKELNEARSKMKAAKLKMDAYKKQYTEYASEEPINQFAVKRVATKLHKATEGFEEAKEAYTELIVNEKEEVKGQVRKENEHIEELEAEVKQTAAVGNKKLQAEQQTVIDELTLDLNEKKRKLERLHALAETIGAPESPPGMYYWPNAEEQKALAIKSRNGLTSHMSSHIKRLQGLDANETISQLDASEENPEIAAGDEVPVTNSSATGSADVEGQWARVSSKLKALFEQKLATMMRTID
jgi:chromosome segregation ATPase